MLSMLGISLLNKIVIYDKISTPDAILNELRQSIIKSLNLRIIEGELKDGMDISLVSINLSTNVLTFSGAYNPIYIISEGNLTVFKGDRMPIGSHVNIINEFTTHEIQLLKNDVIYLFSDGYYDQFGGDKQEKFLSKRFKQMLLEIHNKTLNIQKLILEKTIENWKGTNKQTDDITVVGLKI